MICMMHRVSVYLLGVDSVPQDVSYFSNSYRNSYKALSLIAK